MYQSIKAYLISFLPSDKNRTFTFCYFPLPLSMTTMSEFLLNYIPHHPKILRTSNCLNLRLPRHLQCKTCTTYLDDLAHNPNKKRRTSANKICKRPWQERNSTSRMKVKRISYQGVQSFLSLEGIFRRPPNANTTVARMTTSKSVQKRRYKSKVHQEQEFSWRTRQHATPCCSKFLWKGERKLQQG